MSGGAGGPVFIGGLDQSGKTPMRRILDASTGIAFSRRTYLWTVLDGRYGSLEGDRALARCMEALRGHVTLRDLDVDLDEIGRRLRSGERSYERLFELIGQSIATRAGRQRWGTQEAGVEERADALLERFPTARIIHMVRDPRDRHLAVGGRRRLGVGGLGASIAGWLVNARAAIRNIARHPDRYRIVRFEDLLLVPEETGRRLAAFIGEPDGAAVARAAGAWAVEARGGSDPATQARASRAIDPCEARFVDAMAGEEMDALGYPRTAERLSAIDAVRYGAVIWPLSRARAALTRVTGSGRAAAARMDKVRMEDA